MTENAEPQKTPFRKTEEEAIIALILDSPEFFGQVSQYLLPEYFGNPACKFVLTAIQSEYEKHGMYTRGSMCDGVRRALRIDDNEFDDIEALLVRTSDPREVPHIKEVMVKWAKQKAYGLIIKNGAKALEDGNYETLDKLVEAAQRITDNVSDGVWFFDNIEMVFHNDAIEHFSTGFPKLDAFLCADAGGAGPGRKEVTCWLGPTGSGKSIILVNNGLKNLLDGHKVLHITLENSARKTLLRYLGAMTDIAIDKRAEYKDKIRDVVAAIRRSTEGDLVIQEYPPDEISVNEIYQSISYYERAKGWHPDVVIVDYLDLLISRRSANNDSDYTRQKAVATELRGLAIKENVTLFTATQTNRSGAVGKDKDGNSRLIGIDQISESFGKAMPLDYIVSINQSNEQKAMQPPQFGLYVDKCRNGKSKVTVNCEVNYSTMKVIEKINAPTIIDGIGV